MALGITSPVAAIASSSNSTNYSFGSFTPAADSVLVVMTFFNQTALSGSVDDTSGLTWTQEVEFVGSDVYMLHTAEVGSSPVATVITVRTNAGDGAGGCIAMVFEVTGVILPYLVANATANDNGVSATTPVWTPPVALGTDNGYCACVFNGTNPAALTEPTSWTETDDVGHVGPAAGGEGAYREGGETGTTITWGSTSVSDWRVLGIEILLDTPPPPGDPVSVSSAPISVPRRIKPRMVMH